jgi:hypothetical protein
VASLRVPVLVFDYSFGWGNFVAGVGKFKEVIAASETQDLAAMATQAENETSVAIDKLSNEFKPPTLSKDVNSSPASRTDLEALRSELNAHRGLLHQHENRKSHLISCL